MQTWPPPRGVGAPHFRPLLCASFSSSSSHPTPSHRTPRPTGRPTCLGVTSSLGGTPYPGNTARAQVPPGPHCRPSECVSKQGENSRWNQPVRPPTTARNPPEAEDPTPPPPQGAPQKPKGTAGMILEQRKAAAGAQGGAGQGQLPRVGHLGSSIHLAAQASEEAPHKPPPQSQGLEQRLPHRPWPGTEPQGAAGVHLCRWTSLCPATQPQALT